MTDRLHNALKSEVVETKQIQNFQLALAKLQWSKTDIGYTVHVSSNTWISSGIQGQQYLEHLGLQHCACSFLHGECWAKSVPEEFDLSTFASVLDSTFNGLRDVEMKLEACGIPLVDNRGRSSFGRGSYHGDGHTASTTPDKMKESTDDHFDFVFTFQEGQGGKGWTVHRHPKNAEMTDDFRRALAFLNIQHMDGCPQFDFEECYWSFIPYTGDDFRDGNANWAHAAFGAHEANFTAAVNQLVGINEALKPYGLTLFNG